MTAPLCGVYNDPGRMAVLDEAERWTGTHHAVQTVFTPWSEGAIDDLFDRILPAIWSAGRVPLLTWEPFTPTPDATDPDIAARITAGDYDAYLDRWADRLGEWLAGPDGQLGTADDRRVYLRLAHEMNGDWYPWSPTVAGADGATGPEGYVDLWRYVHDRLDRRGFDETHLQWVWCVNHVDVGEHRAEACYPGDRFVDWVGVDGFNWGQSQEWSTWQSPADLFSKMFDRLDDLTDRPRCVPEFASSSLTATGHDPERKAAWVREAFAYLDDRVELCCWFNEDKETDWAVFGGAHGTDRVVGETTRRAYSAYRDALSTLDSDTPSGGRIVSDAAFLGER